MLHTRPKNPTPLMQAAFISASDVVATLLTSRARYFAQSSFAPKQARWYHGGRRAENSLGTHPPADTLVMFTYPPGLNND